MSWKLKSAIVDRTAPIYSSRAMHCVFQHISTHSAGVISLISNSLINHLVAPVRLMRALFAILVLIPVCFEAISAGPNTDVLALEPHLDHRTHLNNN
jgi:hypothetical protein